MRLCKEAAGDDPGLHVLCLYAHIFDIDTGERIERVIEADTEAGTILRYVEDANGKPIVDMETEAFATRCGLI